MTRVNPVDKKCTYKSPVWTKDGSGIFLISDENGDIQRAKYYDLKEGKFTRELSSDINWDVSLLRYGYVVMVMIERLNEKGDKLIMDVEEDAMSKLYLVNLSDNRRTQLPTPFGTIGVIKFHPFSDLLALSMSTPQTPGDVFVIDLADLSMTKWTESETGFLPIYI